MYPRLYIKERKGFRVAASGKALYKGLGFRHRALLPESAAKYGSGFGHLDCALQEESYGRSVPSKPNKLLGHCVLGIHGSWRFGTDMSR